METTFFYVFGAVAVIASLLVIAQRNPIYSVLLLIASFAALSGLYILLDAPFVAVIQIIVYAGAIMVLFVFVIMLLNAGVEERTKGSRVAVLLGIPGVVIGGVLVAWILLHRVNAAPVSIGAQFGGAHDITQVSFGDPRAVARLLFHDFLLPFEITSILIMIAILGAVVLASRPEAVAKRPHSEKPESVPELAGAGKER